MRLENQIELKSLYKSAGAGLLLLYVLWSGFSFWSCIVFLAGSFAFHVSEGEGRGAVRNILIILSLSALLILRIISGEVSGAWPEYAIILSYVVFVWFVISLSRFRFADNFAAYSVLNAAAILFFSLSILALRSAPSFAGQSGLAGVFSYPILFFAFGTGIYMLMSETFAFSRAKIRGKRLVVINAVLAFIGAEILWVTGFLPLGAVNASALIAVFLVLARDAEISNIHGRLNARFILRSVTIFLVSLLLLLAASPWNI